MTDPIAIILNDVIVKLSRQHEHFCSTTNQIFTLKQILEKSWEYGKDLFACFVDLEKAYD